MCISHFEYWFFVIRPTKINLVQPRKRSKNERKGIIWILAVKRKNNGKTTFRYHPRSMNYFEPLPIQAVASQLNVKSPIEKWTPNPIKIPISLLNSKLLLICFSLFLLATWTILGLNREDSHTHSLDANHCVLSIFNARVTVILEKSPYMFPPCIDWNPPPRCFLHLWETLSKNPSNSSGWDRCDLQTGNFTWAWWCQ